MISFIRHTGILAVTVLALLITTGCSDELSTPQEYFDRGNSHFDDVKFEKAIADYSQAIRIDPEYATAYNNRGLSYHQLGIYEKEIQDYTEAIRIDPEYADAYYNRALSYADLGQHEKAHADFKRACELNSKHC